MRRLCLMATRCQEGAAEPPPRGLTTQGVGGRVEASGLGVSTLAKGEQKKADAISYLDVFINPHLCFLSFHRHE